MGKTNLPALPGVAQEHPRRRSQEARAIRGTWRCLCLGTFALFGWICATYLAYLAAGCGDNLTNLVRAILSGLVAYWAWVHRNVPPRWWAIYYLASMQEEP